MKFWKNVLWFSLANAIVFYLAFMFFGKEVVFGNAYAGTVQGVIVSAVLVGLMVSLVGLWGQTKNYSTNVWMLIYWAVNTVAILVLARTPVSLFTGMGIKHSWIAVVLGFVINCAQYGVWKAMDTGAAKKKKKK